MTAREPRRGWWRSHGRRFVAAMILTTLAVVIAGWFTGIRDVMHGALLSIAVAAFLPFVIIGGMFAIALGTLMVIALGDPGDADVVGVAEPLVDEVGWIPRYYGFLRRRRHPVFWGIPAGLLLGGLALWAVIALIVVPGERRTVRIMVEAQVAIDVHYETHRTYPAPIDGHLVLDGRLVTDGFGRPLAYQVTGMRKLASWTLRSTGFDPRRSADDLCLAGATRLATLVDRARVAHQLYKQLRSGKTAVADWLGAIAPLRCTIR